MCRFIASMSKSRNFVLNQTFSVVHATKIEVIITIALNFESRKATKEVKKQQIGVASLYNGVTLNIFRVENMQVKL